MNNDLFSTMNRLFPEGIRGLIFDCDGVLVDSRAANIGYYNLLLRELGKPPLTKAQEDYAQMATSQQAIEQVLTPEELQRAAVISTRYPYDAVSLPLLKAEPGLMDMVSWLQKRGVRLGIHTNRGGGVWKVLDNIALRHAFDPVMTVEVAAPKPSPDGALRILEAWGLPASQVAFVGDSETDAGAAAGAGIQLIAYASADLPTPVHVNSFFELQDALARMDVPGNAGSAMSS